MGSLEQNLLIDMSALGVFFVIILLKVTTKCNTLGLTVHFDISPFERTRYLKLVDQNSQFILVWSGPGKLTHRSTSLSSDCTRKLFYSLIPGHLPIWQVSSCSIAKYKSEKWWAWNYNKAFGFSWGAFPSSCGTFFRVHKNFLFVNFPNRELTKVTRQRCIHFSHQKVASALIGSHFSLDNTLQTWLTTSH